jgi:E3 ubiquitin-protein ligase TRIP12
LAVQKVINKDNLLATCRERGEYLLKLLTQRFAPPSLAAPYVFDIRGGGMFWGIEFTGTEEKMKQSHSGKKFGLIVQAKCMEKGD